MLNWNVLYEDNVGGDHQEAVPGRSAVSILTLLMSFFGIWSAQPRKTTSMVGRRCPAHG
jgi:hypothetical protein